MHAIDEMRSVVSTMEVKK